jgi:endonuclease III
MSGGRPHISPDSPGGLAMWIGYIGALVETIDKRQETQNGNVARLVKDMGSLPCKEHAKDINAATLFIRKQSENACADTRERKRDLRGFGFKVALVVLGALSVIITNAITTTFC